MKKNIVVKQLILIGLGILMLTSCFPQEQTEYLTIYPATVNPGPIAWSGTVTVKSSESWYMEPVGNADWCTVYPDKSVPGNVEVTVSVTQLPGLLPRTAIYSIKSTSGIEKFLVVEQKDSGEFGYYLEFFGDPEFSYYVHPQDFKPIKLRVNTNVTEWSTYVSEGAEDWLFARRDKDTLIITVQDAKGPAGRKGTVTASAGGSISQTLSFSQMGLHEYGAATKNFSLPIPGIPDSELQFSYVYSRAKITLLLLWGTWCPDCTNFMPMVKELYEEFKDHGFKIYGVAMEIEGMEQEYLDYLESNGMNAIDEETGKKLWWENRPVFNPLEQIKVNAFSRLFYGDLLLTGEVKNFVPAFFFVDGGGYIVKTYVDNYSLRTDANIRSLYKNMRTFLSRQLECCGG